MEQNSSLNTFNPLITPNLVSHESIKKIFTPYFDKNQFEELVFDYMANMI